jgi:hypothetical protein
LQEQLDEIAKQAFDLPAEGIQRKTPKKEANRGQQGGNQPKDRGSGINPQAQVQQGGQQKAGSGAVVVDSKQEVLKEIEYAYDPAEGDVSLVRGLTGRFESYPHSSTDDCIPFSDISG